MKKQGDLKAALQGDDTDKIAECKKELEQASWKISQAAYGQASNDQSSDGNSSEENKDEKKDEKKEEEKK
jgi:hypothetical protein